MQEVTCAVLFTFYRFIYLCYATSSACRCLVGAVRLPLPHMPLDWPCDVRNMVGMRNRAPGLLFSGAAT